MSGVVPALESKRAELEVRRQDLVGELGQLDDDLAAITRVIALLSPPQAGPCPARRPRHAGGNGLFAGADLNVKLLEILRSVDRPMSTHACLQALAAKAGLDPSDDRVRHLVNRVSAGLGELARKGRIRRAGRLSGNRHLWEIAR